MGHRIFWVIGTAALFAVPLQASAESVSANMGDAVSSSASATPSDAAPDTSVGPEESDSGDKNADEPHQVLVPTHIDEVSAVDADNLGVDPGALGALLGPSGAGKSTLSRARTIFDLAGPRAGSSPLEQDDRDLQSELADQAVIMADKGLPGDQVAINADLIAALGREPNFLDRTVAQARVAIARALINDPEILLADEPVSYSPVHVADIDALMAEIGASGTVGTGITGERGSEPLVGEGAPDEFAGRSIDVLKLEYSMCTMQGMSARNEASSIEYQYGTDPSAWDEETKAAHAGATARAAASDAYCQRLGARIAAMEGRPTIVD